MSLEFFGLVASSLEDDASDEEVLGLLFRFFFVVGAPPEVTVFGVVDFLELSEAVDLEPHDLLDEVDLVDLLDLLDEVLGLVTVVVTGFPPEPELQGATIGASTLGILYSDGGLSLAVSSLLGVSTSFTLLGGVMEFERVLLLVNLTVDLGEGDLDLDLGLFKDFEILFLRSCGFLVLLFLLPPLIDLGGFHGRQ